MSLSKQENIVKFAIYSRCLIIFLQVLFNTLIPDHSADVFNPPDTKKVTILDDLVTFLFGGFRRWDAIYFNHIAQYGYTYENTLAFLPLYPLVVRLIASVSHLVLSSLVSYSSTILISGVALNFALFCVAALSLYKLSCRVLDEENVAYKATMLFCMNPASIFFSACYSESMFALCTFQGLFFLFKQEKLKASALFGLSCLTRSNGLVNGGFLLYANTKHLYNLWKIGDKNIGLSFLRQLLRTILISLVQVVFCATCFISFQYYAYNLYCSALTDLSLPKSISSYGKKQGYKMPGLNTSEWCDHQLPLSYTYIQDKHWNNGFLKYYELKQIPNFLLAAPMIAVCISAIIYYTANNVMLCLTLGLHDNKESYHKKHDGDQKPGTEAGFRRTDVFLQPDVYVFIVHLAFLLSVSVFMMHVQVTTRFIASSSPVIYWFIASVTMPTRKALVENQSSYKRCSADATSWQNETLRNDCRDSLSEAVRYWKNDENPKLAHKFFHWYFVLYYFVGAAAFPNFLPWT